MASQVYAASCFKSISRAASADLKQPLIVVQDLESSSSSSSREEQNTDKNTRRRLGILVLLKSLCIGAFVGLLIQTITFYSAFLVVTIKRAKTPAYWIMSVLVFLDIAILSLFSLGGYCMAVTRNEAMHMRKKFDNEADGAPKTESVWTERFLLLSETAFLQGLFIGSFTAWVMVYLMLGLPVPFVSLLFTFLVHVGLCCLTAKYFDWVHALTAVYEEEEEEEEPEDDGEEQDWFFVSIDYTMSCWNGVQYRIPSIEEPAAGSLRIAS